MRTPPAPAGERNTRGSGRPLAFVVMLGLVSLFADMTYEGARSATGPFLGLLGASALAVAIVSSGGELVGYALRFWSGRLADRTGRYWAITAVGYAVNLLAVPLLALAGQWPVAALLIVLERAGKALRTPARDAMLSYATSRMGRGWGFGLHEALDQVGATLGPLIVATAVLRGGTYRDGFAWLLWPALAALTLLAVAWRLFPNPRSLEPASKEVSAHGLPRQYWIYLAACCLMAAGYVDYPLLAFHFGVTASVPTAWIPGLYGAAMAVDALAALAFGRWFDRAGLSVLTVSTALGAVAAPLALGGGTAGAIAGALAWGVGMGAQESVVRAAVAGMAPPDRRGSAYGTFNMAYGVSWFAGSAAGGWLYTWSPGWLATFSLALQLAAIPVLLAAARTKRLE